MPRWLILWRREAAPTLSLAAPLVVAQLLQVGMGFIDTVMAGRISASVLAAVGLGASLWGLMLLGCIGATLAISPLVAHLNGAGDDGAIAAEFHQGLWVAILVGVAAVPITYGMAAALPSLAIDPEIAPLAGDYLRVSAWGMPGLCLYLAPRYLNEGLSNTKPVMLIQLLLLPLNIFGNYLFMFGGFGFPVMGAAGAALSTAIGLWVGAVMMFLYLVRGRRFRHLSLFAALSGPRPKEIARILKLGLPIAVSIIMEVGMFSAVAILMGSLGKVEMAAHQIALNYAAMMFMLPLSISQAVTIRVGHAAGAGDMVLAVIRGRVGVVMAGAIMALSATLLLLFPELIVGLYTNDAAVAKMAMTLLFAAALFQFSDGLQVSASGALRGLKDTAVPMFITMFAYWAVGFPAAWVIGIEWGVGPQGLWGGLAVGLTTAALLLNLRFYLLGREQLVSR
ncbi:MATE family efflux transporter [Sedimenticola sp.]|uniref:MATE family efflux transporter n=1 Tax=Sedimenticola sp. TaxID=1940285 RepID=UPI003D12D17A